MVFLVDFLMLRCPIWIGEDNILHLATHFQDFSRLVFLKVPRIIARNGSGLILGVECTFPSKGSRRVFPC
ncbi:hypothetical protein BV898_04807 [Hypsibius exemplaris]|uniref:Uncharacterized protein n=1 Tax=Hypsibius exemplaris TaxID=2072580 RepID=A0A1W0X1J0_HYPEX|nr:hypothetical protein BV898_04807 [Hypsibius exemplaris]